MLVKGCKIKNSSLCGVGETYCSVKKFKESIKVNHINPIQVCPNGITIMLKGSEKQNKLKLLGTPRKFCKEKAQSYQNQ